MALKAVLQNLDGVPESLRSEYKEQEGKFYLDIEGLDDHHGVGALKRAKDYEKEDARKAKEKVASLTADLERVQGELDELRKNGIPKGDVDRLEASYKDKYTKKEGELTAQITALTGALERHLLEGQAVKLAGEIAAKPEYIEAIMPHVRSRMKLETVDGEHVVRILDKDGKPSALNLEDLRKEVLANKALAPLLSGSKAAGGGANGGGGGAPTRNNKKFGELTERERVEWHREDPAGFQQAAAAHRAAQNAPRPQQ